MAYWQNVSAKVWNYFIVGYQVIKKWLSYREQSLLGRPLTPKEVEEITSMARRLADQLLVLKNGSVISTLSPAEFNQPEIWQDLLEEIF